MQDIEIKTARFDQLTVETLYKLLQLRTEVFIVEQKDHYQELDDRDCEPETRHIWAEHEGVPLSVIRVLKGPDGSTQIGRVCTAARGRGNGLAGRLMELVLQENPGDVWLNAQSYLRAWYESFGFVAEGEEFSEGHIPHIRMRLRRSRGTAVADSDE